VLCEGELDIGVMLLFLLFLLFVVGAMLFLLCWYLLLLSVKFMV